MGNFLREIGSLRRSNICWLPFAVRGCCRNFLRILRIPNQLLLDFQRQQSFAHYYSAYIRRWTKNIDLGLVDRKKKHVSALLPPGRSPFGNVSLEVDSNLSLPKQTNLML